MILGCARGGGGDEGCWLIGVVILLESAMTMLGFRVGGSGAVKESALAERGEMHCYIYSFQVWMSICSPVSEN